VTEWRVEQRFGEAAPLHTEWPEVIAHPEQRALAVCHVTQPALVLGSTQSMTVVDAERADAAGVSVVQRRSGGGAVLVKPGDPVWIDAWLPADDPLWRQDVGRAFDWLGDAWTEALGRLGVAGLSVHRRGFVSCTRWARSVCFGGVGTGEVVTGDGRKVVGAAQRRNRQGIWFHTACYLRWDPQPLVGHLHLSLGERESALSDLRGAAVGVADLLDEAGRGSVEHDQVVSSLLATLGAPASPV
jgi:lipoate-protein ligase A